ncbi:MAG: outer membrane protein transport protein [Acidithiobacillus caldus]|uniref:OmpP1/FadL family transporter n=1 Tax=Acidithiobacillus caldus TaxID=33059 RepID=UPI0028156EB4|nr:outer membrane protein transport protein [Acidithiobacillus caldus]WMT48195.1 MAG: outer membrane protein transport protein [Acidithiobacillus caldus]
MKKKAMRLGVAVAAALSCAFAGSAMATDGYQLIGIGQYAVGMGGAVVAAPDDPLSAAISNPAGLAMIKPQAAFSAEIFNPTRKTNLGFGEIGSHSNVYGIPAIGWVAPAFGDGIVFGGGVYGTSGLGVNYLQNIGPNSALPYGGYAQAYSSITFIQMAPSIAMKVNDHLYIGGSLNIAAEQGSFQQTMTQFQNISPNPKQPVVPLTGGLNLSTPSWAYGVGVTLGALYKVNDKVTLGATYKSPIMFTPLTFQGGAQSLPMPNGQVLTGNPGQYSGHLNYPQQIALGIAIRPIPQWLVSVEGQWINWHNTLNTFNIYGPWNGTNVEPLALNWRNQWVANIGTQYNVNDWLQVRAGYTWGSNPVPNNSDAIAANTIFPAIVQNAITFGATQKLGMGWKLTEAYMHEFSNTMTGAPGSAPFAPGNPLQAASSTLTENSYGIQVGYEF